MTHPSAAVHDKGRDCRRTEEVLNNYKKVAMERATEFVNVRQALRELNKDSHRWSRRPCATCRDITDALGEPFGCNWLAAQPEDITP